MTHPRDVMNGLRSALRQAPEPLTRRQRGLVSMAMAVVAASRLLAVARTPWDWDEVLLSMGVRFFDVTRHHPHPPGFPLFIALGKILHLAGLTEFRALQTLNVVAAILLFPAIFFLFHEARARFALALSAALLLVFSPNVWFFGGTAFTDVPSLTLASFALAVLLRSARNPISFPVGAALISLAAAIRPQNLLLCLIPFAFVAMMLIEDRADLPSTADRRRLVTAGVLLALVIVMGCYGGAAMASGGWRAYRGAVLTHRDYIRRADSFLSAARPSLLRVSDDFFERPYRETFLNITLALLGVAGAIGAFRGRGTMAALITGTAFVPLAVTSWLFLDFHSVGRFAIAYLPFQILLATLGIDAFSASFIRAGSGRAQSGTSSRAGDSFHALVTVALLAVMTTWTLPPLTTARTTVAPPIAAVMWIGRQIEQRNATVSVSPDMSAYVQYLLPRFEFVPENAPAPRWTSRPGWFLTDVDPGVPAKRFSREKGALWNIARQRYFDVWAVPVVDSVVFGAGWYGEEGSGGAPYRWMGGSSVMQLPPFRGGATLYLSLSTPGVARVPAVVTIAANGVEVERFLATPDGVEVSHHFDQKETSTPLTVRIHVDRTVRPSSVSAIRDDRDLGLRLADLNWR